MADKADKEVLRFLDVNFQRTQKAILKNINFSIAGGQKWVILGPNGSGKTTLLSLATGYLFPSNGQVYIFEKQLGHFNIQKTRNLIGYLSPALSQKIPTHLAARDVVMTAKHGALNPVWNTYTSADKKQALNLLKSVGCDKIAKNEFEKCSTGERQRILLARTLMAEPQLLILDEPASGLDLGGREDLILGLCQLEPELPCLLVTHHTEEIPPNFTHLMLLKAGEIIAQGRIQETLTSENLSETFGQEYELFEANGRWQSQVAKKL